MSYKEGFPKFCIGQFCCQLQALITDVIFRPLIPCKQDRHLKGCYFQVKLSNIIRKCYLQITKNKDNTSL